MKIKYVKQNNFTIQKSGRSSDWITPDFIFGCGYGCAKSYCYVARKGLKFVYISENISEILDKIKNHYLSLLPKIINQTGKYYSYDLGCNSDLAVYEKLIDLQQILTFFQDNKIISTFATKHVNNRLLNLNVNKEFNRIRFSLMPQIISDKLEPKSSKIVDRIKAINNFIEHDWEVHINFSPIVVHKDWISNYTELFKLIDKELKYKEDVKSECIFLTHNEKLHKRNVENNFEFEHFLWQPKLQENKISSYGSENIRYKRDLKQNWINEFVYNYNKIIPYIPIRYIF